MSTTVISVRGRDRKALLADPNFCYVGRRCAGWAGSKWGNPFRVQRQRFRAVDGSCCATAAEAVARYEDWIIRNILRDGEMYDVTELMGKVLGCWCVDWDGTGEPARPCHAVVLARLANIGDDL